MNSNSNARMMNTGGGVPSTSEPSPTPPPLPPGGPPSMMAAGASLPPSSMGGAPGGVMGGGAMSGSGGTRMGQASGFGVWCERCNSRLVELKKQAVRLMVMHPNLMKLAMKDSSALYERLHIPRSLLEAWSNDKCEVCATHVNQLKGEAVAMVQSLEEAQAQNDAANIGRLSGLVGSRDLASLQRYLYAHHAHGGGAAQLHRAARQQVKGQHTTAAAAAVAAARKQALPPALQAQQYLEESLGASWWTHPKLSSMLSSVHQPTDQRTNRPTLET